MEVLLPEEQLKIVYGIDYEKLTKSRKFQNCTIAHHQLSNSEKKNVITRVRIKLYINGLKFQDSMVTILYVMAKCYADIRYFSAFPEKLGNEEIKKYVSKLSTRGHFQSKDWAELSSLDQWFYPEKRKYNNITIKKNEKHSIALKPIAFSL